MLAKMKQVWVQICVYSSECMMPQFLPYEQLDRVKCEWDSRLFIFGAEVSGIQGVPIKGEKKRNLLNKRTTNKTNKLYFFIFFICIVILHYMDKNLLV